MDEGLHKYYHYLYLPRERPRSVTKGSTGPRKG